jgi:hypothetical protein
MSKWLSPYAEREPLSEENLRNYRKRRYILMDNKFKKAMLEAIRKGLENPFVVIFKHKKNI